MTDMDTTRLGKPSGAWTSTLGGGAEGLTRRLGAVQIEAIDEAVHATQGRAPSGAAGRGCVVGEADGWGTRTRT